MHDLIKDNPSLAHLADVIDAMHPAKDGSRHPTKALADLVDAGFHTKTETYHTAHRAHMEG